MGGAQPRGALNYALTAKCQTEFLGAYLCTLANYKMVHSTKDSKTDGPSLAKAMSGVPDATAASLANPRAKYTMTKEVQSQRPRNESF